MVVINFETDVEFEHLLRVHILKQESDVFYI